MLKVLSIVILSSSIPAFADLGALNGLYRVDRACSDGSKPNDGLLDGTLFVSFGDQNQTQIYASFLVPQANTYCAERSSGTFETKEDGLRIRVAKREYLGECGGAQPSEEKVDENDAGEFIPLTSTERGFKGTSGTDFEEGGSCKRGTHLNFDFVRVSPSEPAKIDQPKAEEPKVDEPKKEEPKTDEPKVEEPKPEPPKVEEPAPAPAPGT